MKVSTPLVMACAATSAYANVIVRDLELVQSVLSDVDSGLGNLGKAVNGYSGDSGPLVKAAESLISTIKSGTEDVKGSEELSLADAASLSTSVKTVQGTAETLADNFKAQKSKVEEAGECDTTREQTTNLNSASKALIDAIVSKVPEGAQDLAAELSAPFVKILEDVQSEFSESNCKNKNSGGGGGGDTTSESGNEPTTTADGGSPTTTDGGSEPTEEPTTSEQGEPTDTGSPEPTETQPECTLGCPPAETTMATTTNGNGAEPTDEPTGTTPPVVTAGAASFGPAGIIAMAAAAIMV